MLFILAACRLDNRFNRRIRRGLSRSGAEVCVFQKDARKTRFFLRPNASQTDECDFERTKSGSCASIRSRGRKRPATVLRFRAGAKAVGFETPSQRNESRRVGLPRNDRRSPADGWSAGTGGGDCLRARHDSRLEKTSASWTVRQVGDPYCQARSDFFQLFLALGYAIKHTLIRRIDRPSVLNRTKPKRLIRTAGRPAGPPRPPRTAPSQVHLAPGLLRMAWESFSGSDTFEPPLPCVD